MARTLLSQLAAARKSAAGEKATAEIESVGASGTSTSFILLVVVADDVERKRLDMMPCVRLSALSFETGDA